METDKSHLLEYEKAVSSGVVTTEDFNRIMNGASVQAKEYAIQTKGAAGSTDVFVAKQKQAQTQLQATTKAAKIGKQAVAALKTALVSFVVIKGIELIGKFIDNLNVTAEEQKEIVDESIASYKDAKNELETITSELENQTKAMDELLRKDGLTYAEQGQLEELREITKELEIQQDIAQKRAESESKELAEESIKYIEKQYGKGVASEVDINKHMSDGDNGYSNQLDGTVSSNIAAYRQYSALLEEDLKKPLEHQFETYKVYKEEAKDILLDIAEDLMSQKANIQDYYDTLKNIPYQELNQNQRKVVDAYKRIGNDIKLIYREIDPYTWNNMEIDDIFRQQDVEISKENLIKEVKKELDKIDYSSVGEDFNESSIVSDVLDKYPILYDAVRDSGILLLTEYSQIEEFQKEILGQAKKIENIIPKESKFIFSDHEESIKSYKSTMDAVSKTIERIRDKSVGAEGVDINELMGMDEFKNVDQSIWDKMLAEGKVSEEVIKEIALTTWEKLYKSLKDLNGAEPIIQELKNDLEKASIHVKIELNENKQAFDDLQDILTRIKNEGMFTFDEITKYVEVYGDEVADAINIVDGAYSIEEEAIVNLMSKYGELTNLAIASEAAMTKANLQRNISLSGYTQFVDMSLEDLKKELDNYNKRGYGSSAELPWLDALKDTIEKKEYIDYLETLYTEIETWQTRHGENNNPLDKILKDFDNKLSYYENQAKYIEAQLANAEARGYLANEAYYKVLENVEQNNYDLLEDKLGKLKELMKDSGLKENSDEWHELQNEIEETTIALQESKNKLLEFYNQSRQIKWDIFDFSRDRESKFMDEADFLIDLMDRVDKFNDEMNSANVLDNLTKEGMATMGLHAANYNAYLEESIKYSKELAEIQDDIANNKGDTELLNRYDDLLEKQQEAILSAEAEKDAMIDLVSEGIEAQKEAFQGLIDEYTEALDVQKD